MTVASDSDSDHGTEGAAAGDDIPGAPKARMELEVLVSSFSTRSVSRQTMAACTNAPPGACSASSPDRRFC